MPKNPENDLKAKLAKATGLSEEDIGRTIEALADVAYKEARTGFILPGFGAFRVVETEDLVGTNPFTGEPARFKQPPQVEFTLNSDAKEAFLESPSQSESEQSGTLRDPFELNELRLAAYKKDVERLGIDIKQAKQVRCKLGGKPVWIQADQTPICCGSSMLFVAQLDCNFGKAFSGNLFLEYFYLFLCLHCYSPKAIYQIT